MRNKILYVGSMVFPDESAGAQRSFSLSKSFRDLGYEVTLLGLSRKTTDYKKLQKEQINGFTCYFHKCPETIGEWFEHTFSIKKIKQVINELGEENVFAILLMEYEAVSLIKISKYCKKRGIHVIADAEEWYGKSNLSFPKNLVKDFDTSLRMNYVYKKVIKNMICISSFLYNSYNNGKKNMCIVPGTIDLTESKWNFEQEYKPNKVLTLSYAGNPGLKFEKERLDWLINSVIKLNKEDKKINLVIAGVDTKFLKTFYPELDSYNFITVKGKISHKDCLQIIHLSDYSCIIRDKNRVTSAGFPTKFSESIGCKTPVISTDTSDIKMYIKDINGLIIDEYSETGVYRTLSKILNDNCSNSAHDFNNSILNYSRFTKTIDNFIRELK